MANRISATLTVLVDLKVGDIADIKNLLERLKCTCTDASGEDAKILDVRVLDRKLLLEGEDEC